ncbi:MAG: end-binding protein Ku [Acidobacteriaceae bacterium]|jgi:DNA end-binding protein Ku
MALRPYWKGSLRLSLVACPIQVFPATAEREKIRFHQINKRTGHRIEYCKVDGVTGEPVDDEDIVRGYEIGEGRYVEITEEELEAVAIASAHTIDIDLFVPKKEIDDLYWDTPYYVAPDGEVGRQAFAVIREAIGKENVVALGRVVFTAREHVIAIEPRGKGLLGITLRYPYEIRAQEDYFGAIPDEKVPKDMLDLAVHIIRSKVGHFAPEKFEDRYEKALKELIRKKQQGKKIEKPKEHAPTEVISLRDALRRSVDERGSVRQPAGRGGSGSHHHRGSAGRSSARAQG